MRQRERQKHFVLEFRDEDAEVVMAKALEGTSEWEMKHRERDKRLSLRMRRL